MKKIILISFLFLYLPFLVQAQVVNVSTSTQLQNALNTATPGQIITMADGVYIRSGGFYVNAGINGTLANPITLKGSTSTILSSNNLNTGYGFALKGNNYWVLEDFTIYNSKKGIVLDSSYFNTINNIVVNKIGDEGIHIRAYSSNNLVQNCFIDSTGLVSTGTGEGIYVGSAVSNWPTYTAGHPDTCQNNTITGNSFGDHVVSENIDIKEGTKNGIISFNSFNGTGLNGVNYANSWVDVKGNHYNVYCNTGAHTIADGIQTHINYAGYGDYNVFSNNTLTVGSSGYGINITTSSSYGTAPNNTVCSNNSVSGGAMGLSNISTQLCASTSCSVTTLQTSISKTAYSLAPNPATDYLTLNGLSIGNFVSYNIVDGLGKVRKTGILFSASATIDVRDLPAGLYIFSIPETEQSSKFIKQ